MHYADFSKSTTQNRLKRMTLILLKTYLIVGLRTGCKCIICFIIIAVHCLKYVCVICSWCTFWSVTIEGLRANTIYVELPVFCWKAANSACFIEAHNIYKNQLNICKNDEVFQCIYQFYRLAWSSDAMHEPYKWHIWYLLSNSSGSHGPTIWQVRCKSTYGSRVYSQIPCTMSYSLNSMETDVI